MNINRNRIEQLLKKPWLPYALPFALFLLLTEPGRYLPAAVPYLYIAKTLIVGGLLWFWRRHYAADLSVGLSVSEIFTSVFCGILVLIIWIGSEGILFQLEQGSVFNPHGLGQAKWLVITLLSVRLFGSALIVPIMEELFWRSFLMRFLIEPDDFRTVPMGAFSWLSFLGVAILFGLEHNRVAAGVIAGLLYGLLLIHQKKLTGVIIAHAVTNFGLGIYVLATGNWMFW